MNKILLTEKDIEKANTYVDLQTKEAFVESCMKQCIGNVDVSIPLSDGERTSMPSMFMESTFMRSKYLMCAFVKMYLGMEVETEDGDIWLMATPAYDEWAASHVFNQLERMKDKKELRDKCFDILKDYRDLERRLKEAVRGYMAVLNDPINRMFWKLYMEDPEEVLKHRKKELERLQEQVKNYVEAKKETETEG